MSLFGGGVSLSQLRRWVDPATAAAAPRDYAASRAGYVPPVVSAFSAASSAGAGSTTPAYRNVALDLGTGRSNVLVEVPGRFVWLHDWTRLTDYLWVRFNDAAADRIKLRPGKALAGIPFERLYISNDVLPGESVELLILPETPALPEIRR